MRTISSTLTKTGVKSFSVTILWHKSLVSVILQVFSSHKNLPYWNVTTPGMYKKNTSQDHPTGGDDLTAAAGLDALCTHACAHCWSIHPPWSNHVVHHIIHVHLWLKQDGRFSGADDLYSTLQQIIYKDLHHPNNIYRQRRWSFYWGKYDFYERCKTDTEQIYSWLGALVLWDTLKNRWEEGYWRVNVERECKCETAVIKS